MSYASNKHVELRRLLGALCEDMLTLPQAARIEQLVGGDPDAKRFYVRYLHLHGALQWDNTAALAERPAVSKSILCGVPDESNVTPILGGAARRTREYFSQPGPLSVLVAAIFMVCMVSILNILPAPTYTPTHIGSNSTTNSPGRQPGDVAEKLHLVARITGKHNCRWSADGRAPYSYDHLGLGRELKLDAGMVEITYYNGAKVVLEGPVEFTVEKENACRLDVGKLTANVSKQAVGFTVDTPTATIVDLGTEFGVEVEQGGNADVRVFQGVVELQCTGENQTVSRRRITAGQTARVGSDGVVVRKVPTDVEQKGKFVRTFPELHFRTSLCN